MGCDCHVHIEVKGGNHRWGLKDDKGRYWRMFERQNLTYEEKDALTPFAVTYLGKRNYRLFAALADVRNYGDGVVPLFPARGVPADLSAPVKSYHQDWDGDLHSHTYFTLQELMDADLDENCAQMQFELLPLQYAKWKDTGIVPADAPETVGTNYITKDPIHREVSEEEMLLLLASGDPKSLTKKCLQFLPIRKGTRILGGPHVNLYAAVSYRRLLPELDRLIEALAEYGPPDRVRVVLAYDN